MASDKYLISQSLSLLICKMEVIFTWQTTVKFSNIIGNNLALGLAYSR